MLTREAVGGLNRRGACIRSKSSKEPLVVCGGDTGVSEEAGESEEVGLCVEKSGLGASSSTPHWAWLS